MIYLIEHVPVPLSANNRVGLLRDVHLLQETTFKTLGKCSGLILTLKSRKAKKHLSIEDVPGKGEGKTHVLIPDTDCAVKFDQIPLVESSIEGPMIDTVAYKKIDDNSFEGTSKKAGKVVSTVRIVVAKDGKSMTVTVKGKNAKGEAFSDVIAYDRQ